MGMNDELKDRRVESFAELDKVRGMLFAATGAGQHRLTAYAVEVDGILFTCLGYQRAPNEWVPLCLVPGDWSEIPQESEKHFAVRSGKRCPMCRDEGRVTDMELQYADEDVGDGWMCPRCRYEE